MEVIDRIDQMINEIHVPHSSKTDTERQLDQEKKQLELVSLLPEEFREERTKGILNYCKGLIRTWRQKKLHSDREMYIRQANSRINETFRRAKDKILKLDDCIIELKNCKDIDGLKQIDAKMPTIW